MAHRRRGAWRAARTSPLARLTARGGERSGLAEGARLARRHESPRVSEERAAKAALLLAALALVLGLPPGPSEPADCSHPRELAAREGWTIAVSCREMAGEGDPLRGPVRLLFGKPLDLNRADARALEALPGIGPSRAAAIVLARREAPFRSFRDLERVRGIGPRIASGLRDWVEVSASAAAAAERRPPLATGSLPATLRAQGSPR